MTLDARAFAGGATVTLSSSKSQAATVPSTLLVPEGQSTATFAITTNPVNANSEVTVVASCGGQTVSSSFTVTAPPQIVTAVAPGFAVPGEQRMMMSSQQ